MRCTWGVLWGDMAAVTLNPIMARGGALTAVTLNPVMASDEPTPVSPCTNLSRSSAFNKALSPFLLFVNRMSLSATAASACQLGLGGLCCAFSLGFRIVGLK